MSGAVTGPGLTFDVAMVLEVQGCACKITSTYEGNWIHVPALRGHRIDESPISPICSHLLASDMRRYSMDAVI